MTASLGLFNVKDYGAVGDNDTDDSASIQAAIDAAQGDWDGGGVVYFPPGLYRLGATLLVKESNITLAGATAGSTKLLLDVSATFPAITFTGYLHGVAAAPTNNGTFPWNFSIEDMWIEKGTPVTNSAPAISLFCIQKARLNNVHIKGFGTGVLCSASFNVYAHQVFIQSNSPATIPTLYGWKFDSDYANYSSYLSHCIVGFGGENIDPAKGPVVTTYGYYHGGKHPSDWFLDHCEADVCTYGYYHNGATSPSPNDVFDIHFVECVADQAQYGFTIANNLAPGPTGGLVDIDSCYWANRFTTATPTPNGIGICIAASSGVTVRGFQGISGNAGDPTRYQNNYGVLVADNSRDVSITGCNLKGNFVQGIFLKPAEYVSIFGNTILQTLPLGGNGMYLVGSNNISIVGNTVRSLPGLSAPMRNGICVEGNSNNITIGNNVVDASTVVTPLSVAAGSSAMASGNIGIANRTR